MDRSLLHTMLALALFGCGDAASKTGPRATGAAIQPRLGHVLELPTIAEAGAARRREAPNAFGELRTAEGDRRPRTCVEWELFHAAHAEPTNDREAEGDQLAAQRCEALSWLTRGRPSARSHVAWNERTAALLPGAIAPAWDAAAKVAREGKTFRAYAPNAATQWSEDRFTAGEPGGKTEVEVRPIAWADFDGDGNEDLLLAVTNLDREGPMTEHRVLAVTRDDDTQPLRVLTLR
jgi:hypothetical protein